MRRENTIDAFRHAAELGADAVELDVRRTRDDRIVVHHDDAIEDKPLVEMTRAEVESLAPWVPDLADALRACFGMWVNIEVKNYSEDADWDPGRGVVRAVLDLVEDMGWAENILVSSFDLASAEAARGRTRAGWLVPRSVDTLEALDQMPPLDTVNPHFEDLAGERAAAIVEKAHAAGLEVMTWTVDNPDVMRRLAGAGVDGIFTNVPDVAVAALAGPESQGSSLES